MDKGVPICLEAEDFTAETLHARREWDDRFKVMKEKKNPCQSTSYPSEIKGKHFPRQWKPNGIYHQQICLLRNAKGNTSNWIKRILMSNAKTSDGMKLTGKSKCTIKFRIF